MENQASQKAEPKISLPIAIFIGIIMAICDVISLIPGAGDILAIVVGVPEDFFLWLSGLNMVAAVVSQIIKAIPILQALPVFTTQWIIIVLIDRNQKLESIANMAGSVASPGGALGEVGNVAKTAETVAQEGKQLEKTVETAQGVVSTTEKGLSEAKGAAQETLTEKVERHLEEKADLLGQEKPSQEEVAEEVAREKQVDEALGGQPEVMESVERGIFKEPVVGGGSVSEDAEDEVPAPSSKVVRMPSRPSSLDSHGSPSSASEVVGMTSRPSPLGHNEGISSTPDMAGDVASPEQDSAQDDRINEALGEMRSPMEAVQKDIFSASGRGAGNPESKPESESEPEKPVNKVVSMSPKNRVFAQNHDERIEKTNNIVEHTKDLQDEYFKKNRAA